MLHSGSNRLDNTGHFVAKDPGVRRFAWIQGKGFQHVPEIDSGSFYFDQHLAGIARSQGERYEA